MFDQTSGYCVQPSWYINKPSQHLCFRSQKLALCTDFRSWLRPGRKLGILWSLWLWEPSRDSRKFYFVGLHYITNDSLTEFKVGEHSARLCILPPNVQKQEGHERRAKSGWCARARGESHMCIQGSQRPTFFTAKSRLFQLTVSKKQEGFLAHGVRNKNHLLDDFMFLSIIMNYFETSFHYPKLQFVHFFPKPC